MKRMIETMANIKRFTINLPVEKHRQLKMAAMDQYTTMTDILMDCIDRVIQENEDRKAQENED